MGSRDGAFSSPLHPLLLLSDSALPLGSFAFSSGLESFLAHHKHSASAVKLVAFDSFLHQSLANVASTALPYVVAAHRDSGQLDVLDNDFDASTPCTVARRASVGQGRALLAIWDRALSSSASDQVHCQTAREAMSSFSTRSKASQPDKDGLSLNAHFPPLFGATCQALGLSSQDTLYLFLLNHAKALLSAAVRASVMGPYQSHAILASKELQTRIQACMNGEYGTAAEHTAVTVPTMDLWMGRHELLYSRIFNS